MIVKSNNTFPTHIPRNDGRYQLIAPTNNILTKEEYDAIKESESFVDAVDSGIYVVKGEKKTVVDNQIDIFEGSTEPVELKEVIESTLGATIIKMKPLDAIGVIKDIHVKSHLEGALKDERRQKVRKAINDQIKTLETDNDDSNENIGS